MTKISKIDGVALGLITVGALSLGITSLTKRDVVAPVTGRKSSLGRSLYGLVGISAIYQLARTFGPKTRQEKMLIKASRWIDQIDEYQNRFNHYQKQFNHYRREADTFFNRRLKSLKTATSS